MDVVYYVRVGQYIKIGTTTDLVSRIRAYPPDARLLAVEFGGRDLEARRLREFRAHLAARSEWFRASVELLAHIAALRAATDLPPLGTRDVRPTAAVLRDRLRR